MLTAVLASLLLSACSDDYLRDTDTGYHPPRHGNSYAPGHVHHPDIEASRSVLLKHCKGKIREKVRNRLGHQSRIAWGRTDYYNNAPNQTTINGQGTASHPDGRQTLHFRCIMDRRDAYVRRAWIELDGDSGTSPPTPGGNWDKRAFHACKARIRSQVKTEISGHYELDFSDPEISAPSKSQRKVSGKAILRGRHGNGHIRYRCKLRIDPLRIEDARYRVQTPLPVAKPTMGTAEARQRCQRSLKKQLQIQGFDRIELLGVTVHPPEKHRQSFDFRVRLTQKKDPGIVRYRCSIDIGNGEILRMDRR